MLVNDIESMHWCNHRSHIIQAAAYVEFHVSGSR